MITLEGTYYDGRTPISVPARMEFANGSAELIAGQTSLQYSTSLIKVSPRIAKADRFIALPNNGQFQCPDYSFLDSLPQASPSEGPVAWLEKRWGVALFGIVITACLLLAGYFYGLPAVAEHVAARIPIETEDILGRSALAVLDKKEWFKPTDLNPNRQKAIREGFDSLLSVLPLKDYYHLEFRASPKLGANAFAFPGGTIVITDDMVESANSQEEVLAVLAHEIGHVKLRHMMRSLLQNSAVAVMAAAVTSDAASLSVAVAGLPTLLAQMKYSREFEAAADEFAFKLLKRKGYSPLAFASLMERLAIKYETDEKTFVYVSTHPVTEERMKRARAAAGE